MRGEWRRVSPTACTQSQRLMSDVSASSPAVLYEVTWSLTSIGSLLPQKLNRDCRIWFHVVLWSTTVRATERNQDVFHWQPSQCCYSWCYLLPPWFTVLFLLCVFLCPCSTVIFSSPLLLNLWISQVGSSQPSLWVTLAGNAGGHEILGHEWDAILPLFFSIWAEENCS